MYLQCERGFTLGSDREGRNHIKNSLSTFSARPSRRRRASPTCLSPIWAAVGRRERTDRRVTHRRCARLLPVGVRQVGRSAPNAERARGARARPSLLRVRARPLLALPDRFPERCVVRNGEKFRMQVFLSLFFLVPIYVHSHNPALIMLLTNQTIR